MPGPFYTVEAGFITPIASADAWHCSPIVYQARRLLARGLAAVRLHYWEDAADAPPGWRCKRRRPWARYVIQFGNAYLDYQGAAVRVMPLGEWLNWEVAVAQVLGRATRVAVDGAGLEVPYLSGRCLGTILRRIGPPVEKLSALKLAAHALRELHTKSICRSDASPWSLSHGDATCENVIVSMSSGSAEWIDFDMRHEWSVASDQRHADDLRSLVFSSAACLPTSLHGACVESLLSGYCEPRIVRKFGQMLEVQGCPNVFQLAQGAISYSGYCNLRRGRKPR